MNDKELKHSELNLFTVKQQHLTFTQKTWENADNMIAIPEYMNAIRTADLVDLC
jgi:hypothetical protein